jgi:hypothetical protein
MTAKWWPAPASRNRHLAADRRNEPQLRACLASRSWLQSRRLRQREIGDAARLLGTELTPATSVAGLRAAPTQMLGESPRASKEIGPLSRALDRGSHPCRRPILRKHYCRGIRRNPDVVADMRPYAALVAPVIWVVTDQRQHLIGAPAGLALEIRLVRSRHLRVLSVVIFMLVLGTDVFLQLTHQRGPIGYGRRPGRREDAFILDGE